MSYQEKQNIVNIFSGIAVTALFGWIIYQRHLSGQIDLINDFKSWGIVFLIFAAVSIVARIIIQIVFHIFNAIATREEDIPKDDERDKLIKLKATRNSYYAFSGGMVFGFLLLAFGLPVFTLFIVFVITGLVSEIVDNGSQIYFYRRGF